MSPESSVDVYPVPTALASIELHMGRKVIVKGVQVEVLRRQALLVVQIHPAELRPIRTPGTPIQNI